MRYVNVFKSNTDEHRLKCINRMRAMIYDAYNNPVFIMIIRIHVIVSGILLKLYLNKRILLSYYKYII